VFFLIRREGGGVVGGLEKVVQGLDPFLQSLDTLDALGFVQSGFVGYHLVLGLVGPRVGAGLLAAIAVGQVQTLPESDLASQLALQANGQGQADLAVLELDRRRRVGLGDAGSQAHQLLDQLLALGDQIVEDELWFQVLAPADVGLGRWVMVLMRPSIRLALRKAWAMVRVVWVAVMSMSPYWVLKVRSHHRTRFRSWAMMGGSEPQSVPARTAGLWWAKGGRGFSTRRHTVSRRSVRSGRDSRSPGPRGSREEECRIPMSRSGPCLAFCRIFRATALGKSLLYNRSHLLGKGGR